MDALTERIKHALWAFFAALRGEHLVLASERIYVPVEKIIYVDRPVEVLVPDPVFLEPPPQGFVAPISATTAEPDPVRFIVEWHMRDGSKKVAYAGPLGAQARDTWMAGQLAKDVLIDVLYDSHVERCRWEK